MGGGGSGVGGQLSYDARCYQKKSLECWEGSQPSDSRIQLKNFLDKNRAIRAQGSQGGEQKFNFFSCFLFLPGSAPDSNLGRGEGDAHKVSSSQMPIFCLFFPI